MISLEIAAAITTGVILAIAFVVIRRKQQRLSERLDEACSRPAITSIETIDCPAGSIVVLKIDRVVPSGIREQIAASWEAMQFNGTRCVVVDGELTIDAVLTIESVLGADNGKAKAEQQRFRASCAEFQPDEIKTFDPTEKKDADL